MSQPDFEKMVFVIMPIGDKGTPECADYDRVYNTLIKRAVDDARLGLTCLRADERSVSGNISTDIYIHVTKAKYVIADLTWENVNVFYELGIRHAQPSHTILLAQRGVKLPFDTSHERTVFYSMNPVEEADAARDEIGRYLSEMTKSEAGRSPVQEAYRARGIRDVGEATPISTMSGTVYTTLALLFQIEGYVQSDQKSDFPLWRFWEKTGSDDTVSVIAVWFAQEVGDFDETYVTDVLRLTTMAVRENWSEFMCVFAYRGLLQDKEGMIERILSAVKKNHSRMLPRGIATSLLGPEIVSKLRFNPVDKGKFWVFDNNDLKVLRSRLGVE
jgi:hypothetical protein